MTGRRLTRRSLGCSGVMALGLAVSALSASSAAAATTPRTALNDVSCTSATFCLAVGVYAQDGTGHPVVERWNGASWTVAAQSATAAPAVRALTAVECTRTTFCFVLAERPGTSSDRALVWDGSALHPVDVQGNPSAQLNAVACSDAAHCSMVGAVGDSAAIWLWSGTRWRRSNVPRADHSATLTSVSCPVEATCLATGFRRLPGSTAYRTAPVLLRRDGRVWSTRVLSRAPSNISLAAVDCVAAYTCTVLGSSNDETASFTHVFVGNLQSGRWAARLAPLTTGYPTPKAVSCQTARRCTGTFGLIGLDDDGDSGIVVRGASGAFRRVGQDYAMLGGTSCDSVSCEVVGSTLSSQRGSGTIFDEPSRAVALNLRGRTLRNQSPPSLPR